MAPSASVFHYATACFEGLKAFRGHDGKLRLLRPQHNCARMLASATRISLPEFAPDQLLKLIEKLLIIDAPRWLPADRAGNSLYIRPTLIGTDDSLGFQPPQEALLFVIVSYWPNTKPQGLRLLASNKDIVRAWPGGVGLRETLWRITGRLCLRIPMPRGWGLTRCFGCLGPRGRSLRRGRRISLFSGGRRPDGWRWSLRR
ncbi:D-aminoacid aminotransferase-like PLP-dependent enzyme [Aspergillus ellipticus CBS 707.79]|uniref:D-aminoacid aminotransferase-like PLP-dependent enzyme n=1 Tax=Aspergillus ellipticus CBS 707.79 TaxID=1448320 RepID=A0A319DK28_9EURO|nr:D-aminoacid aminotransferase-like PLP-dependent enzyme [Aspergillus ellipticus CBS 707.79]